MRCAALVLLVATTGDARAEDHTHTIVPSVTLEGGPGKSELSLSLDIIKGVSRTLDMRITPQFRAAASDGVTTLFSADGDGFAAGGAWQLGGTFSIINLRSLKDVPHELVPRPARLAAVAECVAECAPGATTGFCGLVAAERAKVLAPQVSAVNDAKAAVDAAQAAVTPGMAVSDPAVVALNARKTQLETTQAALDRARIASTPMVIEVLEATVDPQNQCAKAQDIHTAASKAERDLLLQWPERTVSFGILLGQTRHKFLRLVDEDAMTFTLAPTKSMPKLSFGISYLRILRDAPITVEVNGRFDSEWQSRGRSAEWCRPAGMVTRPDGSGLDPAQICDKQPLGAPTPSRTFTGSAYLGLIDPREARWRIAVGVTGNTSFISKADNAYEVGFAAPISFRTSLLDKSLSFIARVTPSMVMTHDSDGTEDARFLLTVALIADRNMFQGPLD